MNLLCDVVNCGFMGWVLFRERERERISTCTAAWQLVGCLCSQLSHGFFFFFGIIIRT